MTAQVDLAGTRPGARGRGERGGPERAVAALGPAAGDEERLRRALVALGDAVAVAPSAERARILVPAPGVAPLEVARLAPREWPLVVYLGRDGHDARVGVGVGETRAVAAVADAPLGWRYFGALDFDGEPGDARVIAPRVEAGEDAGRSWLAANLVGPGARREALAVVAAMLGAIGREGARTGAATGTGAGVDRGLIVGRRDQPERVGWDARVEVALDRIARGELDKIVLARRTELLLARDVDPLALLEALSAANPLSARFLFRDGDGAFVGATPERLFSRRGRRVETEAIAGTRARGAHPDADRDAAAELLASDKDRREHALVVDAVRDALAATCDAWEVGARPELLRLDRLMHLRTPARGHLRAGASDLDLLRALHPTPAVCGTPRGAARAALAELEPFARGRFAGPVGWFAADGAEVAVGIRAAVVGPGPRVALTAGAGLVRGSDPAAEWDEVESKMAGLLAALTAADPP